jgi:hypothetical protein
MSEPETGIPPWFGDMKAFIAGKIAALEATPPEHQPVMPWRCDLCHDMGYVLGELPHPLNPESVVTVADYCTCDRARQEREGARIYAESKSSPGRIRRPKRIRLGPVGDNPDGRIGG